MDYPELYVLRHGETVWNAEDRMQGWLNSPLTRRGIAQAERQRDILKSCELAGFGFISSPLGRAFQTAAIAVGDLAESVHTDMRLREIGVGDWAGRLRSELPNGTGEMGWVRHYEEAPNGEGFEAVGLRVTAFLADLRGPAVLITHGITSRILREIVAGPDAIAQPAVDGGQGCVFHLKNGVQRLLR